jgi:hypothetical protein
VPARRFGHGQAFEQYARLHALSLVALPIETRPAAKTNRSEHTGATGSAGPSCERFARAGEAPRLDHALALHVDASDRLDHEVVSQKLERRA